MVRGLPPSTAPERLIDKSLSVGMGEGWIAGALGGPGGLGRRLGEGRETDIKDGLMQPRPCPKAQGLGGLPWRHFFSARDQ